MSDGRVLSREYLDALAEQIATFSLRIDLATQAMLTYLREFDSPRGLGGLTTTTKPSSRSRVCTTVA